MHRGAGPRDRKIFGEDSLPALRDAVGHLSWLFTRGYAAKSALKLVGDRFELTARQRTAVLRAACSDQARDDRRARELRPSAIAGRPLALDGYNVLTTIEAALAGGVLLHARDGCVRDMASMHGTYRKVAETLPALHLLADHLEASGAGSCLWLLDSPVSNSGRLKQIIRGVGVERGLDWSVELVADPDRVLGDTPLCVVSADSGVLDRCGPWLNLVQDAVVRRVPSAWILELGD
jgi:hypothetical protein